MSDPHKKLTASYTPHALHPALTPELMTFFNSVAPQRTLLSYQGAHHSGDQHKLLAYSSPGTTIGQLAELRIRQWVLQQEQDARQQQHKRLFGSNKP